MLKNACFFETNCKILQALGTFRWPPAAQLGTRAQTPTILPTLTVLLQNVLNLSPMKKLILISKISVDFNAPFVILLFRFSWFGDGTADDLEIVPTSWMKLFESLTPMYRGGASAK